MNDITIGDIVELKSGGPAMTVNRIQTISMYWCIWFDKDNKLQEAYFKPSLLKRVNNER